MEYFWMQQDDIPSGMGYPLFGITHLFSVGVTFALVFLFILVFIKVSSSRREKILRVIPPLMLALEIAKDLFLVYLGRFGVGYLPLHMCGMGIFVFLFIRFLPRKKVREFFGEVACVLILPSAVAALFFADWTPYYPVLNFMNLYSYLWHGLLILYPCLLMIDQKAVPTVKHIRYVILFLCAVVPPVYVFDRLFGCNYLFLIRPVPNSPLSWLASLSGVPGYLFGYAILALLGMLAAYLVIGIVGRWCKRI